jgi:AraC-like DNA-binding protein
VVAEIARAFSEPDFDLDHIVGRLGLSRRYIQQLLEETGQSFTERLVERRLERAFAMLTDSRCLHLAIIDIARAAALAMCPISTTCSAAVRRYAVGGDCAREEV